MIRIPYVFLLGMIIAMNAAIRHHLLPPKRNYHSLDAARRSRKAARSSRCIALRVQRVDGRRVDAFVADLHCSRVRSGAAPTVSNVSARAQRGIGSCEG